MPAGPIGTVWRVGTWSDTCWEENTWADLGEQLFASGLRCEHHVLTLNGSAQALSSITGATSLPLRKLFMTAGPDNDNPIYIGGSNRGLTDGVWGVRIKASVDGEPADPFDYMSHSFDHIETRNQYGHVKLSDVYVRGTAGEKLHILVVTI